MSRSFITLPDFGCKFSHCPAGGFLPEVALLQTARTQLVLESCSRSPSSDSRQGPPRGLGTTLSPSRARVGRPIRNDLTASRGRAKAAARASVRAPRGGRYKTVGRAAGLTQPSLRPRPASTFTPILPRARARHSHTAPHPPKELTRQGRAGSQGGDTQVVEGDLVSPRAPRSCESRVAR